MLSALPAPADPLRPMADHELEARWHPDGRLDDEHHMSRQSGSMVSRRTVSFVDDWLIDDALDAYVYWRERRAVVWDTYKRWSVAWPADAPSEFLAYRSALDQEELAAGRYADLIAKLTTSLARAA